MWVLKKIVSLKRRLPILVYALPSVFTLSGSKRYKEKFLIWFPKYIVYPKRTLWLLFLDMIAILRIDNVLKTDC